MEVVPLGHACFKLKGKKATVVCDPFTSNSIGLAFPRNVSCEIVTISHDHDDHNASALIHDPKEGKKVVISGPGEYESRGVEISGVQTFHDEKNGASLGKNTIYKIDIDNISVVHCGDLGHQLTEVQTELLTNVDILLVPTGGFYTINAGQAAEVVAQLEPAIVIPMHYQRAGLKPEMLEKLSPVSEFLKEMGQEGTERLTKLNLKKDDLPEETKVVVLE